MKKVIVLPSFERAAAKLAFQEKAQLAKSLTAFNSYLASGHAPFGFRWKKIDRNKYEFRIDIRLRVVVKVEGDFFYLVLVGSHDDVGRYLRDS
ncbi:MAG: hypothetical protein HY593_04190 [Candidatus Omnitrophica bacterium]|nr:hypothetical protein [Candidatus Omnitrophota bacterium]